MTYATVTIADELSLHGHFHGFFLVRYERVISAHSFFIYFFRDQILEMFDHAYNSYMVSKYPEFTVYNSGIHLN